jgi:hypothetical protein
VKKILIILLISFSQSTHCQDWIRYYGYGHQPYASYCIEQYDKGYILLGDIQSYKYGWIIKTDINGNQLWDLKIGDGIHSLMPSNIEQTRDNGFILCGVTTMFNSPQSDPFIIKLNACGQPEWCRGLVVDNDYGAGVSIKPTPDGGFCMIGMFYGNNPYDRIRMFKFDSIGELLWVKIYNKTANINSEAMYTMYTDSTTVLMTGFCYYPDWLKPYFIETDTAGNENWRLVYSQHTDTSYVGEAWTTVKSRTGNYYSVGRRENFPELLKFSSHGYELMNKDLLSSPPSNGGASEHLIFSNDTTIIIDGGWSTSSTVYYYALIKTDTLGNIRTTKYLPDSANSGPSWLTKTSDNKILLIGMNFIGGSSRIVLSKFNSDLEYDSVYTRHFIYDSLCPHPIVSDTIVPSCVVVGIDEPFKNPETAALKVYPNPAGGIVTVEFPKHLVIKNGSAAFGSTTVYERWKSTTLEVYDLSGKRILQQEVVRAQTTMELDVSSWHGGMYYFRLSYNGHTVAGAKVVVR